MRIVFFIQGLHVAASRYRVLQYLPLLQEKGFETEVFPFPDSLQGWARFLPVLKRNDIIFVQRKRLPVLVLFALHQLKKPVVYDFDDAIMFKNSLSSDPYSLRRVLSFKRMLRYTTLVIAGNDFLKNEAAKYHTNIRVLPTPVDANRYTEKIYGPRDGVNLGWIGDHGSIHYMKGYRETWEEIGRRHGDAFLTIICDTFMETESIPLKKVQWQYDTEIDELKRLDIGLMPLYDDLWSRGKCGFKIIQYLAAGVPAVCTPVGINRDVVENGVNGFWADTKTDWIEKLSILIKDRDLRERMGKAGRQKILDGYTVQACAPKLMTWLKEII